MKTRIFEIATLLVFLIAVLLNLTTGDERVVSTLAFLFLGSLAVMMSDLARADHQ